MAFERQWKEVVSSRSPECLVKGIELATLVCGPLSRFQICAHRVYDAEGFADEAYRVRDAHTVTDAQVKEGVRPEIVARFDTLEKAEAFVNSFARPVDA